MTNPINPPTIKLTYDWIVNVQTLVGSSNNPRLHGNTLNCKLLIIKFHKQITSNAEAHLDDDDVDVDVSNLTRINDMSTQRAVQTSTWMRTWFGLCRGMSLSPTETGTHHIRWREAKNRDSLSGEDEVDGLSWILFVAVGSCHAQVHCLLLFICRDASLTEYSSVSFSLWIEC